MNRKLIKVMVLSGLLSSVFSAYSQGKQDGLQNSKTLSSDMVLIKGGTFSMGSPESESWRETDELLHTVTVNDFYISKYELSQKEYSEIMGTNPSGFKGDILPVESVTWYDAVEYCNARSRSQGLQPAYMIDGKNVEWDQAANGYRLPTEAEWEYACRAGTATPFNTGNNISVDEANYFGTYPYTIEDHYFAQHEMDTSPGVYREKPVEIDKFEPNQFGLYNMHGNVSEWCFDVYGEYDPARNDNPSGPAKGFLRVVRGGGWNDFGKHLRSSYRSATPSTDAFFSRGFRLVRNF